MNQEVTWTSEETVREEVVGVELGPEPTDIHAPHRPGHGLYARGIGKSYKKREVVKNVSIEVHRGEAVGLLGPNGAGKTTSFYMIVGLVQPDTGSITLDGADITQLPMYRRARLGIGYLPQEASIFRGLNVEQNILAALEVVEPDPDQRQVMLDGLLSEFGISHLRRSPSLALSGGNGAVWKLPVHWPASPIIFCWMNHWPGLTPLPWGKFVIWYLTSRIAVLAC